MNRSSPININGRIFCMKRVKIAIPIVFWLVFVALFQLMPARPVLAHDLPAQRLDQLSLVTYTLYFPLIFKSDTISVVMQYGIQPDPRNYTENISHVQTIGFEWVRLQMAWKDVEWTQGTYDWTRWDETIEAYHQAGINVLLCIPKAPDWARPVNDDKSVEGLPVDPQTYADFVVKVVTRYQDKVQAVEIWSEQNLYYEVGGLGRVDPVTYMALLKAAYTAIKATNTEITIISGGLTPTGAPPPVAVDDREYLKQMYALGLKDYADAVGAHPSGFANPPDALYTGGDYDPTRGYDDHRSFFFRNTMEDYRQIIVEADDALKPIWATEFGWPVWRYKGDARFAFAEETSLEEQAQYTQRAYEMGKEWGWVGAMFLWNLDYAVTNANSELANFSILTPDGPTPAYTALKDMAK
jgi:hypothetical protein